MRSFWTTLFLLCCLGCGSGSEKTGAKAERDDGKPRRTLPPRLAAAAEQFAKAVVAKDYQAAYGFMSAEFQKGESFAEFRKTITAYVEPATFRIRAGDDDPAALVDDSTLKNAVHDLADRRRVLDEAQIEFQVGDNGWFLTIWFVEEAGNIRFIAMSDGD